MVQWLRWPVCNLTDAINAATYQINPYKVNAPLQPAPASPPLHIDMLQLTRMWLHAVAPATRLQRAWLPNNVIIHNNNALCKVLFMPIHPMVTSQARQGIASATSLPHEACMGPQGPHAC